MSPRMSPGVALLAPVPEEHLLSGANVCATQGMVAFGSKAWTVFRRLDEILDGQSCDCLLYASASAKAFSPPTATWAATYIGHVEGRNGAHPDKMKFRPPSTEQYEGDNQGHWAVFWHLENLSLLPATDFIKVSSLRGFEKPKHYLKNFIPEGPIIVEW